uniref:Uncharacterized protein n=2 Tax=Brassica oleracea TaxID=3712 RepID=A0A0D3AB08_BRAOL|nr:unnamed protein product [Brassica oleracea]
MAMSFSSLTNLVLFCAATLLLVHAGARNLQQTQTLPVHGAASPTKAESPTFNAPLDDRKNFIVGGAAGVGGFMGMPGGTGHPSFQYSSSSTLNSGVLNGCVMEKVSRRLSGQNGDG